MSDQARTGRFGQRTRIAYDAYSETSPKLKMQKRNTTITLRVVFYKHYMWRVLSFMFLQGRLAMPQNRRG